VADGNLLHQTAYPQRAQRYREIQIEGIKIDFCDPHERVAHEIKGSNKLEDASVAQLFTC
jgi:CRISPR-associated exonuclease Cas4